LFFLALHFLVDSKMTTQDIVTRKVSSGSLGTLNEMRKLPEMRKLREVVGTPVDDQFSEIDPREERAFVRLLLPLMWQV
jgi:hypothetical protein